MKFIVAILLLAFLAGVFDSCMDIRRDNVPTFLANVFGAWYVGGPQYSLPLWGRCDFWHFSKSCMFLCLSAVAMLAFFFGVQFFAEAKWHHGVILFLAIYWIEGLTFALFYHVVWRL